MVSYPDLVQHLRQSHYPRTRLSTRGHQAPSASLGGQMLLSSEHHEERLEQEAVDRYLVSPLPVNLIDQANPLVYLPQITR